MPPAGVDTCVGHPHSGCQSGQASVPLVPGQTPDERRVFRKQGCQLGAAGHLEIAEIKARRHGTAHQRELPGTGRFGPEPTAGRDHGLEVLQMYQVTGAEARRSADHLRAIRDIIDCSLAS